MARLIDDTTSAQAIVSIDSRLGPRRGCRASGRARGSYSARDLDPERLDLAHALARELHLPAGLRGAGSASARPRAT